MCDAGHMKFVELNQQHRQCVSLAHLQGNSFFFLFLTISIITEINVKDSTGRAVLNLFLPFHYKRESAPCIQVV